MYRPLRSITTEGTVIKLVLTRTTLPSSISGDALSPAFSLAFCDSFWLLEYVPPERSTGALRDGSGVCAQSATAQANETRIVRNAAGTRSVMLFPHLLCARPVNIQPSQRALSD